MNKKIKNLVEIKKRKYEVRLARKILIRYKNHQINAKFFQFNKIVLFTNAIRKRH